jgi:hypothetical protein
METTTPQEPAMMFAEPQKEHKWLHKLVGEWTYESEVMMGPDQPAEKAEGTESVRSLGGLWILAERNMTVPSGPMTTLETLGYDPQKQCYVGTFIASMMTHLWIYDKVELDASGRVLTLSAEGPSCAGDGTTGKYRDVITFESDDHRTLTSFMQGENGEWNQFMTAHYRRQK